MISTEQMLLDLYGTPTLDTDQLARLLHKTPKTIREQVYTGVFPIRTYKLGTGRSSRRVADVADVAAFLDRCRASAPVCPGETAA